MASTSAAANTNIQIQESFYGWDLLYRTISPIVNKKSDILIALVHFLLTKNSNFRCLGIGEDKTLSDDEIGSELLPDGWNDDDVKYALRYSHNKQLYLLLGHITEDCIIINLLDVKTKKVSNIGLEPDTLVVATNGPITTMIPNVSDLTTRYRRELIDPVFQGTRREVTTQTTTTSERSDPLRISEPMRPIGQFMPIGTEPRPFGFPDVGRGDLDPLGRGGPGNLFAFPPARPALNDPPRPRFDPYGPPERSIRPNPNPDHLPPPNFGGHDYYM